MRVLMKMCICRQGGAPDLLRCTAARLGTVGCSYARSLDPRHSPAAAALTAPAVINAIFEFSMYMLQHVVAASTGVSQAPGFWLHASGTHLGLKAVVSSSHTEGKMYAEIDLMMHLSLQSESPNSNMHVLGSKPAADCSCLDARLTWILSRL